VRSPPPGPMAAMMRRQPRRPQGHVAIAARELGSGSRVGVEHGRWRRSASHGRYPWIAWGSAWEVIAVTRGCMSAPSGGVPWPMSAWRLNGRTSSSAGHAARAGTDDGETARPGTNARVVSSGRMAARALRMGEHACRR
jgi:hypothetical protein